MWRRHAGSLAKADLDYAMISGQLPGDQHRACSTVMNARAMRRGKRKQKPVSWHYWGGSNPRIVPDGAIASAPYAYFTCLVFDGTSGEGQRGPASPRPMYD